VKRTIISLVLVTALVLGIGSAALAAPVMVPEEGQFVIFGDYGFPMGLQIGAGYGITDNLTIGGFYSYAWFGAYATLTLDPFVLNAEYAFLGLLNVSALYTFDLDPFTLGLGGGFLVGPGTIGYIEAAASIKLGDNFAIYGAVDYLVLPSVFTFDVGLSLTL